METMERIHLLTKSIFSVLCVFIRLIRVGELEAELKEAMDRIHLLSESIFLLCVFIHLCY